MPTMASLNRKTGAKLKRRLTRIISGNSIGSIKYNFKITASPLATGTQHKVPIIEELTQIR